MSELAALKTFELWRIEFQVCPARGVWVCAGDMHEAIEKAARVLAADEIMAGRVVSARRDQEQVWL